MPVKQIPLNASPGQSLIGRILGSHPLKEDARSEDEFFNLCRWFIRMRWIACAVSSMLILLSVGLLEYLDRELFPPLATLVACLIVSNIIFTLLLRRRRFLSILIELQAYTDLLILTAMLHYSGGIENPISFAYLFHVIIGGIILSARKCYTIVIVASALFAAIAFGEMTEFIPHYTLRVFPHPSEHAVIVHAAHESLYVTSRVALQLVLMSLTAYFTTTIMGRLRSEEERAKTAESEMMHSAKMAVLGRMAAGIAHEVGNPLASISTRLLLLDRKHDEEFIKESLGHLKTQIDRIDRIVRGISQFASPGKGEWTVCRINDIVTETMNILKLHPLAKSNQVQAVLAKNIPETTGVKDQLIQVFLNLGINALEAMPQGGNLTIKTYIDGTNIGVAFTDTGKGITEEIRSKLFDPFATTKTQGLGLGLWIAYNIVSGHGGRIEVESMPEDGSTFTVTLPVRMSAKLVKGP